MSLRILAVLALIVSLSGCGSDNGVDPATSPEIETTSTNPRYAEANEIYGGRSVRGVARTYCGGEGRIGDFARILRLPRQTRNLDRIARKYGTLRAENLNRDEFEGSPSRSEILWATYQGCLAGLREAREG